LRSTTSELRFIMLGGDRKRPNSMLLPDAFSSLRCAGGQMTNKEYVVAILKGSAMILAWGLFLVLLMKYLDLWS
jgi:hypothetical protein